MEDGFQETMSYRVYGSLGVRILVTAFPMVDRKTLDARK